jgi:hypothetical protein
MLHDPSKDFMLDESIESGAFDPAWGPPEDWPGWTDDGYWEPGPADEPFIPSDEDWKSYREFCAAYDQRLLEARMNENNGPTNSTDEDIINATGCCG